MDQEIMPQPYSTDLHWRVIYMHLAHRLTQLRISTLFSMSEHTIGQYVHRFYQLGNVQPLPRRHRPNRLLCEFEQVCRTLRFIGCTRQAIRQITLQRSEVLQAQFMAMVSMYDPRMLILLDDSSCDRRQSMRKYTYRIPMWILAEEQGIQPFQSC